MKMLNTKNNDIDSKESFYKKILEYYSKKNKNEFSTDIIEKLSLKLSTYLYNQYSEFRKAYPKSIKRYSKLKTHDLENPYIHDKIILFAKEEFKNYTSYINFCCMVFKMSNDEFIKYEERRRKFYEMF